jgi:uncharacterized protein YciI
MDQCKHFVYVIRSLRKDFLESITEEEERIMAEHFQYLKKLHEKGKIVLAGPCLDGAFGIVVFTAKDLCEAQEVMEQDPSVQAGSMKAELHPFRVSLRSA